MITWTFLTEPLLHIGQKEKVQGKVASAVNKPSEKTEQKRVGKRLPAQEI